MGVYKKFLAESEEVKDEFDYTVCDKREKENIENDYDYLDKSEVEDELEDTLDNIEDMRECFKITAEMIPVFYTNEGYFVEFSELNKFMRSSNITSIKEAIDQIYSVNESDEFIKEHGIGIVFTPDDAYTVSGNTLFACATEAAANGIKLFKNFSEGCKHEECDDDCDDEECEDDEDLDGFDNVEDIKESFSITAEMIPVFNVNGEYFVEFSELYRLMKSNDLITIKEAVDAVVYENRDALGENSISVVIDPATNASADTLLAMIKEGSLNEVNFFKNQFDKYNGKKIDKNIEKLQKAISKETDPKRKKQLQKELKDLLNAKAKFQSNIKRKKK